MARRAITPTWSQSLDWADLKNKRRRCIVRIKVMFRSRLEETGWLTGPIGASKPLRAWFPTTGKVHWYKVKGAMVLTEWAAMTLDGPITDLHMAAVVTPWSAIPLEDLMRLELELYHRHLPKR